MKQPLGTVATILAVNFQLLIACVCGFAGWALWPQTPEWWGLGVMSVILGMACIGGVINALRFAWTGYSREKVLADYRALGGEPKTATLANRDRLKQAGIIDD